MSTGICWINDQDVDTLGLELRAGTSGWMDGVGVQRNTVPVPGQHGAESSDYAVYSPRTITLVGQMDPSTIGGRLAEIDTLTDHFQGELEVRFGDAEDKVMTGWLKSIRNVEMVPSYSIPDMICTVEIQCDDPVKYDRYGQVVAFGTTKGAIPLGTEQSVGTIQIMGAATAPILSYKDITGTQQEYMSFSVTLATGDYLSVDLDRKRIRTFTATGGESNGISTLASGDFFTLNPADGNKGASAWPTLDLSTGGGVILYKRAWST